MLLRSSLTLLFLFVCLFSYAQDGNETYFEELVCKEAEAHHHQVHRHLMRSNPLTENYDLKYYRYEWYVDPVVYFISGTATCYFETRAADFSQINFDFTTQLQVSEVLYHGNPVAFVQSGDYLLTIDLPAPLASGTLDSVSITYAGAPPSGGFGSFEQSEHNGVPIIWTLSEPFGIQDWWPGKNELGDKIDSIDVIITTPQQYRAASIGLLVHETVHGDSATYHWQHRYPITPYLVALCVTNFVQYTDTVQLGDGTILPMLNYVYPESVNDAKAGTANLIQVLQYFDSLFVQYPFAQEKYGHAQWGWGGGEEHQTMSFVSNFNWGLLSHELAHQWFGDMVTCGSWEDIWLNEGFATYLEGISRERFQSAADWFGWKANRVQSITAQSGGSVKVTDTTSVNRIFSSRLSYSKGAYLLHMLRWKLGDENFFEALRSHLNAYEHSYAKTPQLKAILEDVSGTDLTEYFEDWYAGQGHPTYTVTWQQVGEEVNLILQQTTSHTSVDFFEMPVPLRLNGNGIDTMIRLEHISDGQFFSVPVSFSVNTIDFDPDLWLISKNNVVQQGTVSATEDLFETQNVIVFPNPVKDILHLQFKDDRELKYSTWKMFNTLGQCVLTGACADGTSSIDVRSIPAGIYRILLSSEANKHNAMVEFVRQ